MIVIEKKRTIMIHCILGLAVCATTLRGSRASLGQIAGHIAVTPPGTPCITPVDLPAKLHCTLTSCSRPFVYHRPDSAAGFELVSRRPVIIFHPQKFSGRKTSAAEVFLGKVPIVLPALVFRPSGTFPGPAVEIFRRWVFSGLGIFFRNSVYSYATNQVVVHHMY